MSDTHAVLRIVRVTTSYPDGYMAATVTEPSSARFTWILHDSIFTDILKSAYDRPRYPFTLSSPSPEYV